jgi:hypothetical protein
LVGLLLGSTVDQVKEDEMGGHAARMRETRNAYKILVVKPEGKTPLGRLSHG